jgi:hypothetical protein
MGTLNKSHSTTGTDQSGIILNQRTSEEFYRFGKTYHDEAKRILTYLPTLPSKFNETAVMSSSQAPRITSVEMMVELEEYLNKILGLSPLICNLFYLRDFIFNSVISNQNVATEISLSLNESRHYTATEEKRSRTDSFSLAFDQFTGVEETDMKLSDSKKDFFMQTLNK